MSHVAHMNSLFLAGEKGTVAARGLESHDGGCSGACVCVCVCVCVVSRTLVLCMCYVCIVCICMTHSHVCYSCAVCTCGCSVVVHRVVRVCDIIGALCAHMCMRAVMEVVEWRCQKRRAPFTRVM